MPTSHAERARLAHRVLRLRESGHDTPSKVRKLADEGRRFRAEAPNPRQADLVRAVREGDLQTAQEIAREQTIWHAAVGPRLGAVAIGTVAYLDDEDDSAPTDAKLVEKLFSVKDLGDVWREWDDAVTANLEATLPDAQLRAWRKANQDAEQAFRERREAMEMTGEWHVHEAFGHDRHGEGAANAFYDFGREGFADGTIAWTATPVFKVALVDSADYTVNLATHQFMSSVTTGVEETSPALANKTKTAGVLDADDTSFTAAAGDPCEALVIFMASALAGGGDVAAGSQRLVGYIDTATGLPVTLNGGNVNVAWDSGTNRIAKL